MNKNERTRVTVNGNVYDDDDVLLGAVEVTLPNIEFLVQNVSGAGIQGNIDIPVIGQINAMSIGIKFTHPGHNAYRLAQPRLHNIVLRIAEQEEDVVSRALRLLGTRHHMGIYPKSFTTGTFAPASNANASGEYTVHYWQAYEKADGVESKFVDIDQLAEKFEIDGVDYLAEVRALT